MCGFVGIIGVENAAASLFMALQAVQHRGQDAAGIGTWNNGYIHVHKDIGMVSQAPPRRFRCSRADRGLAMFATQRPEAAPAATRSPS